MNSERPASLTTRAKIRSAARHTSIPVLIVFICSTLATLASGTLVCAGSPIYVGSKTTTTISMDSVDHSVWNHLLQEYVDDDGRVDYRSWKTSQSDTAALAHYLKSLSTANDRIDAKRASKLAFWINAYNAVTVYGILREYPTSSIRNHTAKLFGYNIWHDLQLYVGGKPYSLDHIEHKILRKMNDARIHFAIVCASVGCPRLLNEAYVGSRVLEQLESNSKDFFTRSQNFRHDESNRRFYLSAILDWFGEDFGESQRKQLQMIAQWLPTESARSAARSGSVSVSYLDYNWNLNAQP